MKNKSPLNDNVKKGLIEVEEGLAEVIKSGNQTIERASKDTLDAGGKRLRPALVLLCGGLDKKKELMPAAVAVEAIHMASLIHDDLIDQTDTRRGKETVNHAYGEETAVKVGDFLFAKSFEKITETGNAKAVSILAKSAIDLTIGEILQQKTAYNPKQGESLYMSKIKYKTASLFEAACKIAAILSGKEEKEVAAMALYGSNLGLAFQIYDDILDITGDPEEMGKPAGSDLTEGVVTLPYIYAMDESERSEKVREVIGKENPSSKDIEDVLNIVKSTGAISNSKNRASNFINYAIACLEKVNNKETALELKKIATFAIDRYH